MTNRLAVLLGLAVIAAIALDIFKYDAENLLFLSKKMLGLIEWLAFWR